MGAVRRDRSPGRPRAAAGSGWRPVGLAPCLLHPLLPDKRKGAFFGRVVEQGGGRAWRSGGPKSFVCQTLAVRSDFQLLFRPTQTPPGSLASAGARFVAAARARRQSGAAWSGGGGAAEQGRCRRDAHRGRAAASPNPARNGCLGGRPGGNTPRRGPQVPVRRQRALQRCGRVGQPPSALRRACGPPSPPGCRCSLSLSRPNAESKGSHQPARGAPEGLRLALPAGKGRARRAPSRSAAGSRLVVKTLCSSDEVSP